MTSRFLSLRRRGFALIVTLASVVLLTLLLVAFFSRAILNRQVSKSSVSLVQTDQLARSALESIVGELRQEIAGSSVSTPVEDTGVTIYTPNPGRILPVRDAAFLSEPNLLRVSKDSPPENSGAVAASSIFTTEVSQNGRSVPASRWDRIQLRTAAASGDSIPKWILVNRDPAVTPTAATAGDVKSGGFVTGRYAYSIYDEGGLLDINVAGYPSVAAAAGNLLAGNKISAAYADLTAIPGLTRSIADWRDPAASYATAQRYDEHVLKRAAYGFRGTSKDSNAFLSRGDLIAYAGTNGITGSLRYLATANRALNSPSLPAGDNPVLNPNFSMVVEAGGKPLQRFPLSRLALLDQNPAAASPADLTKILNHFGLKPAPGASNTYRAWQYLTPTVGSVADAIAAHREPNLFELMHDAIANNSLGVNNARSTNTDSMQIRQQGGGGQYFPETNIHHQIARMVANMIDQHDADNYPTTIIMGGNPVANTVYGIEHLPYFSEILLKILYPAPWTQVPGPGTFRLFFELWNPHRGTAPATGPTNVRIVVNPEAGYNIYYRFYQDPRDNLPPLEIDFDLSVFGSPRFYPAVYTAGGGGLSIGGVGGYANATIVPVPMDLGSSAGSPPMLPEGSLKWPNYFSFSTFMTTFALQYQDADGNWRTYTTFAGHDNDRGNSGFHDTGQYMYAPFDDASVGSGGVPLAFNISFPKPDPRTFRFRTGNSARPSPNVPMWTFGAQQPVGEHYPDHFIPSPAITGDNNRFLGFLFKNNRTRSIAVQDNEDGTVRVGDGYLGDAASPMGFDPDARPIILNRPFRSVGELGYVFRDSPWKSLNFFSSDSGDSGLLDIFCLEEGELIAGRSNLNTPHAEVLQALLQGATQIEGTSSSKIKAADAESVVADIVAQTATASLTNLQDLATGLTKYSGVHKSGKRYPEVKNQREALVRALAAGTQTRTWNLLLDLVVQTGRYPLNPADLSKFIVEGEVQYWVHVAIDRYTGQILKIQKERVDD